MQQHELRPPRGAKKARKRLGRGNASGKGTYAGKGMKGQQARSGYKTRPGFEGGQTALIRRLPARRGFRNPFRVEYAPVNVRDLQRFAAGTEVTPETLREAGVIDSIRRPVKILGDGDLSTNLTVKAHRVSAAARAKIEAAGGTVEELTPRPSPEKTSEARTETPAKEEAETAAQQTDSESESEEEEEG